MKTYGMLAEFPTVDALRSARAALSTQGYRSLELFTPWPVDDAPVRRTDAMSRAVLVAFIAGVAVGLGMQYIAAVHAYPIDVGGRPPASWPAFAPAAVEMGMLFAALAALATFCLRTGLPRLYRPEFNIAWFDEASRAGFLLLVRADDPLWEEHRCARDIAALHPMRYALVPA